MIDIHNPCSGVSNWAASVDPTGGTPGRKNSIDAINPDQLPPQLIRSYSTDSITVFLLFNETLDSIQAANFSNYSVDNDFHVISAIPIGPLFDQVKLVLDKPMQVKKIYTITVNNIPDCSGNFIGAYNKAICGIAESVLLNDVVVNEILFDPKPDASDYVELYNKSNKIIDASKLFISNRNANGTLNSIKKINGLPYFLFPETYLVITDDGASLNKEYFVKDPLSIMEMVSLPSYPNDKGSVVLTDNQATVIDEVTYSQDWHFPLIINKQGVALERIDPSGKSQEKTNWHSAASTAGYGTPTYKNSQYKQIIGVENAIEVHPKVFSPDNDGYNDITTIFYNVDAIGYVANITIFDGSGRQVRYLVKNNLLGLKGNWNWDGLDESGQKLPIGSYIIFTELFNLEGKKKQFKNTVILTRKM